MSSGSPREQPRTTGLLPLTLSFEQISELIERTRWADGFSPRELESLAKCFRAYGATKAAVDRLA